MKALSAFVAVLVVAFTMSLSAQNQPAPAPAACGDLRVSMAVHLNKSPRRQMQPESGKALVYVIQDAGASGALGTLGYPTTKVGIDGKWVGANKKNSFSSVDVTPGEHHLCVAIQAAFIRNNIELAHLTTEAGRVYYYRTRIIAADKGALQYFSLEAVDSDEGEYLVASYPQAKAHLRK
jgi:hypothetical protein